MRAAPVVQAKRTATAATAASAVLRKYRPSARPAKSPARSIVTEAIMPIFASKEIHCSRTFPAMYFLLSPTVPISRLLIIIKETAFSVYFRFPRTASLIICAKS